MSKVTGASGARRVEFQRRVQAVADRLRGLDYLAPVEVEDLGLDPAEAKRASASAATYVLPALRELGDVRGMAALDVGCAKGHAMRIMRRLPFARVDGIELSPELVAVARRNLRGRAAERSQVWQADARTFDGYGRYDVLFLHNPFPARVVEAVARQIAACHDGPLAVLYNVAVCEAELCEPLGLHAVARHQDGYGNPVVLYRRDGRIGADDRREEDRDARGR